MIKLTQLNEDIDNLDKKVEDQVVVAIDDATAENRFDHEERLKEVEKDFKPLIKDGEDLAKETSAEKKDVHTPMHEDFEEMPVEAEPEEFGVDSCLNQLIRASWEMIDEVNGVISTLADAGADDAIMATLQSIVDDEMLHVGQLEAVLPLGTPTEKAVDNAKQLLILK